MSLPWRGFLEDMPDKMKDHSYQGFVIPDKLLDEPYVPLFEKQFLEFVEKAAYRRDFLIREALGKWVSEIEPIMIMVRNRRNHCFDFVGLSYEGCKEVIVPVSGPELTIKFTIDGVDIERYYDYDGFLL
jgi:hypothetical protein